MRSSWAFIVGAICALTGFIFVASGVTAGDSDLRPVGGDVESLLDNRSDRVAAKRTLAQRLSEQIEQLTADEGDAGFRAVTDRIDELKDVAGFTELEGRGVRVTLTDAPRSVDIPGLDPNVLIVHQQDLQAFVNAMWAGNAEAVTLQGQRLISTTGIKCVGSTVVLQGIPYAPPYVIEAIGNVASLNYSLSTSPEVKTYADYAKRYGLGLKVETDVELTAPAYQGTVNLDYASATG